MYSSESDSDEDMRYNNIGSSLGDLEKEEEEKEVKNENVEAEEEEEEDIFENNDPSQLSISNPETPPHSAIQVEEEEEIVSIQEEKEKERENSVLKIFSPPPPKDPSPNNQFIRRSERIINKNKADDGPEEAHIAQDMTQFAYNVGQEISKNIHPGTLHKIDKMTDRRTKGMYIKGVVKELNAHLDLDTFKIIKRKELPKGSNLIDTGFIHKLKTTGDKSEDFVKSRLVGRGYGQKFGIDFFESYAPTIDPVVIRAMVALSVQKKIPLVQADVETAFLQANFKYEGEVVFSRPPPGFRLGYQWVGRTPWWDNDNEIALQWLKPTYGFVQAGSAWNHCLGNILLSLGFTQQNEVDPCLFVKRSDKGITHVLAYHVERPNNG